MPKLMLLVKKKPSLMLKMQLQKLKPQSAMKLQQVLLLK
jgi:hypothetical protein